MEQTSWLTSWCRLLSTIFSSAVRGGTDKLEKNIFLLQYIVIVTRTLPMGVIKNALEFGLIIQPASCSFPPLSTRRMWRALSCFWPDVRVVLVFFYVGIGTWDFWGWRREAPSSNSIGGSPPPLDRLESRQTNQRTLRQDSEDARGMLGMAANGHLLGDLCCYLAKAQQKLNAVLFG